MRLHGDREPRQPQVGTTGGATCLSGAANEVWSYGEEAYKICRKYIEIRESMRDYTRSLMKEAHEKGTPIMRTLFYEFPDDVRAWEMEEAYMYGNRFLVAPVFSPGIASREVYLPAGARWRNTNTGEEYEGGMTVTAPAPLSVIPVFELLVVEK